MSHADAHVCDGDQQQEAAPSFSNCVDLIETYLLGN